MSSYHFRYYNKLNKYLSYKMKYSFIIFLKLYFSKKTSDILSDIFCSVMKNILFFFSYIEGEIKMEEEQLQHTCVGKLSNLLSLTLTGSSTEWGTCGECHERKWLGRNKCYAAFPQHRAAFYTIQTDGFTQCMLQTARFLTFTSKHLDQLEK